MEFICIGYRDHDAIRRTESCPRSMKLRPGDTKARERLKERFPDSRFDPSSKSYQCNRCASAERLIKVNEDKLRELEARELGKKKSTIKIWTRDDRLDLFRRHLHRLHDGRLKTAFTAKQQAKGRQRHAANVAAGTKYPKKIGANLKRLWLADFLPKRLSAVKCIVCGSSNYLSNCRPHVFTRHAATRYGSARRKVGRFSR